jgi:fatty acid desaturase
MLKGTFKMFFSFIALIIGFFLALGGVLCLGNLWAGIPLILAGLFFAALGIALQRTR